MTTEELVSLPPESFEAAVLVLDSEACDRHAKALLWKLDPQVYFEALELDVLDRLVGALNEGGGAVVIVEKLYRVAKRFLPYEDDLTVAKLAYLIMNKGSKGVTELLDLFHPDRARP